MLEWLEHYFFWEKRYHSFACTDQQPRLPPRQFVANNVTARQLRNLDIVSEDTEHIIGAINQIETRVNAGAQEPSPVETEVFEEAEAIRRLVEQQELDKEIEGADTDADRSDLGSAYSILSEAETEVPSLSYLPHSIRHVDSQSGVQLQEDALLDTGDSACAISLTVAHSLGLDIQEDNETTVRTAALGQELIVHGTTHVALRWRDEHDNKYGRKTRVFVVHGLSKPMILSRDFIKNNPEVSQVAKKVVPHLRDEINETFFTKLSKDNQRDQDAITADKTKENRNRAAEEKRQKLQELVDRLQRNTQERAAPSTRSLDAGSQTSAD